MFITNIFQYYFQSPPMTSPEKKTYLSLVAKSAQCFPDPVELDILSAAATCTVQ